MSLLEYEEGRGGSHLRAKVRNQNDEESERRARTLAVESDFLGPVKEPVSRLPVVAKAKGLDADGAGLPRLVGRPSGRFAVAGVGTKTYKQASDPE